MPKFTIESISLKTIEHHFLTPKLFNRPLDGMALSLSLLRLWSFRGGLWRLEGEGEGVSESWKSEKMPLFPLACDFSLAFDPLDSQLMLVLGLDLMEP